MTFAVLPPELNSARMYAGAGSTPMLAAAAAWDGLAEELGSAAASFESASSGLAGGAWQGPASVAMASAAAPYVGWLTAAADRAKVAAGQARAAASAFEAAQAAMVHPAMIAANRAQLVSLVAANLLGHNVPAIAAVEAEYDRIWAQDVAAMVGYHVEASAVAAQLMPWQLSLQSLAKRTETAFSAAGLPLSNVGIFNTGSFNPGGANADGHNVGFGNKGNGNIGLVLTGGNQVGIGGLNLGTGTTGLVNSGKVIAMPMMGAGTALIMGGTGNPQPDPAYLASVDKLYIAPSYPLHTAQGLYTPARWWPITGISLHSPFIDTSVLDGFKGLNTAIMAHNAAGEHTVVFGYSQSAGIATLEMRHLETLPAGQKPDTSQLSFVLIGNPNRPDGGLFERFSNQFLQDIGITVSGATPTNAYPTTDYAIQYDGIADFPRYPINLVADANAVAGMLFLHPTYSDLTPAQVASGVVQPVSPADTQTTYILIPTQNLPLLEPLRAIPIIGNPLADLVQPDLRVLVDLGYDRTAYQDVPTPAGLFPNVDPGTVAVALQQGALQGLNDAMADIRLAAASLLQLPRLP